MRAGLCCRAGGVHGRWRRKRVMSVGDATASSGGTRDRCRMAAGGVRGCSGGVSVSGGSGGVRAAAAAACRASESGKGGCGVAGSGCELGVAVAGRESSRGAESCSGVAGIGMKCGPCDGGVACRKEEVMRRRRGGACQPAEAQREGDGARGDAACRARASVRWQDGALRTHRGKAAGMKRECDARGDRRRPRRACQRSRQCASAASGTENDAVVIGSVHCTNCPRRSDVQPTSAAKRHSPSYIPA